SLGDEVFILLTLMDDKERLPVAGKVIWITPPGAQGNRTAGIGVQLNDSAAAETAKTKIESMLAGMLGADKPTHTMSSRPRELPTHGGARPAPGRKAYS